MKKLILMTKTTAMAMGKKGIGGVLATKLDCQYSFFELDGSKNLVLKSIQKGYLFMREMYYLDFLRLIL